MLATMSELSQRGYALPLTWSDVGVSELPTGTVTLLLADVEGSTRLWENQPGDMTAAVADLERTLCEVVGAHGLPFLQPAHTAGLSALRHAMGDDDFDAAWGEGAELSTEAAIAYAQRGRGERKRPSSGWGALTPAELDVVRLVTEGLANKAVAARLFVSPRTVETHLSHVYAKLGLTSRVQLVAEAIRHG